MLGPGKYRSVRIVQIYQYREKARLFPPGKGLHPSGPGFPPHPGSPRRPFRYDPLLVQCFVCSRGRLIEIFPRNLKTRLSGPAGYLDKSYPCHTFCRFFKAVSLFAFTTHFPDNALRSELAVGAGIGTCLAVFKAFPAVADLHLLALYI